MIDVAVIGAGIAGLACARRLAQAGLRPVLFDKGYGIGGRVATRRVEGLQYGHGAQYVTARGEGLATVLRDLETPSAAALGADGSGRGRMVGVPGMSALAKAMGAGLDVRLSAQVMAIRPAEDGWRLRVGDAERRAARVVVTAPAPQAAGLLGLDHPLAAALAGVRLDPCLTLMATVRAPARFVTRDDPDDPLAWIAQDSGKPGRPSGDAVS